MRAKFVKFGKTVKTANGGTEHAEISYDLDPRDFPEEAMAAAKDFVNKALDQRLKATIGDHLQSNGHRPPALPISSNGQA